MREAGQWGLGRDECGHRERTNLEKQLVPAAKTPLESRNISNMKVVV